MRPSVNKNVSKTSYALRAVSVFCGEVEDRRVGARGGRTEEAVASGCLMGATGLLSHREKE